MRASRYQPTWIRVARTVLVWELVLLLLTGGPWAMLQAIAWGKMLFDYSRSSDVAQAIIKTFNGRNPCRMCQSIAQARAEEQRKDPSRTIPVGSESFWVAIMPSTGFASLSTPRPTYFIREFPMEGISHAPPVPPPRRPNVVS
ncbi:MAG: hypothetical protein RMM51_06265 [Verrucomicrobiae bacterium]|nr:hypothetical protein [Verrucomicrobiae bacterium]